MSKVLTCLAAGAALMLAANTARAQSTAPTNFGQITYMAGGWTQAYFRVVLTNNTTTVNPGGCSQTTPGDLGGYMVDPSLPAHDLFVSMLMTAYAQGQQVRLTISGCSGNWPAIIGVEVQPASS